jgi:branched-chain amino acid transport system substrate-binding protein
VTVALSIALVSSACGTREPYSALSSAQRDAGSAPSGQGSGSVVSAGSAGGVTPASVAGGQAATGSSSSTGTAVAPARGGEIASSSPAASGPIQVATGAATGCTQSLSPIVLGSVGEQSGLFGSIIGGGALAVQAWAAWVNASGGIHCHPVKYYLADDGADPTRQQALVQQEVEQDHVVAFLQMDSALTGQASVAYLAAHDIPVIGSEGASNWFNENPDYFPATASGDAMIEAGFAGMVEVGKQKGFTKYGTINCIEVPLCSSLYNFDPGLANKFGVQIVYRGQGSLVQPDYTSDCQGAKQAGAQILFVALDPNSIERFGQSCSDVGYHPVVFTVGQLLSPALPTDPELAGVYAVSITYPWMLTANPVVAQQAQVIDKYAPGLAVNAQTMQGWVAAQLFDDAVANIPDQTTSQAILDGLWTIHDDDLGGTTYPLTFVKGQDAPKQYCGWLIEIVNGQFTSPGSSSKVCGTF